MGSVAADEAAAPPRGALVHVVGARPNFVKAAPVVRALATAGAVQVVVHTGQHYDREMSDVFFEELGLPEPDVNLGVGSGSHAVQTAALLVRLEETFGSLHPRGVVVYGDVNSTIAAALVASKLLIPVAHVEAGLRSFDRTMPEEVNRVVTDQLSDLLFTTSPEAEANLRREGVAPERIHFVGNPMIDTLLANRGRFDGAPLRRRLGLTRDYAVATIHRPANVDEPRAAARIVGALAAAAAQVDVVLPLHPRGVAALRRAGLDAIDRLTVIAPLGYVDFVSLVAGARVVITDSGGVQEETTILGVPCLTVRPNTERPITITHGTNRLVEPEQVGTATGEIVSGRWHAPAGPPPLWDGRAGERIAAVLGAWHA